MVRMKSASPEATSSKASPIGTAINPPGVPSSKPVHAATPDPLTRLANVGPPVVQATIKPPALSETKDMDVPSVLVETLFEISNLPPWAVGQPAASAPLAS